MKVHRKLTIAGPESALRSFPEALTGRLPEAWSRNKVLENTLRAGASSELLCFKYEPRESYAAEMAANL